MASPAVLVLGIVGSGIMAAGIAEVALIAGHDVVVRSRSIRGANDVAARVAKNLDRRVERGKLDAATRDDALTRLTVTAQISDLAHCSIVLESIVEDMDSKVALLRELDTVVSNRAILATNTSTLSVSKLAMTTSHPNRVCGIHFFNPATTMPLVEIIRTDVTTPDVLDTATAFVASCGKDAVHVRDDAGFIVNALLFPYLNNAIKMMERGTASMDDIDTAMKGGCNFPMGPFALLDLVGLDTSLSILRTLHEASGNPADAPAETLLRLVADGHLGRKTGQGFHTY
ncbi:MAG: 3-hydroxybutyryl-CoA dehydrogenase [Actinobacteria bacterium]|nr:3-hydroxybutyryl-CoA dehydrogenase [Actinomycetota bacterium]